MQISWRAAGGRGVGEGRTTAILHCTKNPRAGPADYAAAKKAYDDEMHARIIARLKKIPYSKRGRWRPVD